MRVIGVLGGMSWESTQSYYKAINEGVNHALGGFHSAPMVLVSVDFAEIEMLQGQGNWQAVPLYDTTALHASKAVAWALGN